MTVMLRPKRATRWIANSPPIPAPWAACLDARRPIEVVVWSRMPEVGDPILIQFRAALADAYGERIERVVLFGSRARGDARADSDYDIAVFLEDFAGIAEEMGHIAEIETDILMDTGAVINALPLRAGAYRERTGLMAELRREGRDL